jgi:hypothetical protein
MVEHKGIDVKTAPNIEVCNTKNLTILKNCKYNTEYLRSKKRWPP